MRLTFKYRIRDNHLQGSPHRPARSSYPLNTESPRAPRLAADALPQPSARNVYFPTEFPPSEVYHIKDDLRLLFAARGR